MNPDETTLNALSQELTENAIDNSGTHQTNPHRLTIYTPTYHWLAELTQHNTTITIRTNNHPQPNTTTHDLTHPNSIPNIIKQLHTLIQKAGQTEGTTP